MKILHLLFILGIFTFSVQAQTSFVQFGKDTVHLGNIPMEAVQHNFLFKITSEGNFKIKQVKPDCACAVAEFPKQSLSNNSIATISVTFDPYKPGPFEKIFEVVWANKTTTNKLILKGYVEPQNLPKHVEFGKDWGMLRLKNKIVNLGNISDEKSDQKTH